MEEREEGLTVIETKPMSLHGTIDVTDASREGLALMQERVENQTKMLKIALQLTSPNQWQIFGDSVYPCGGAADTILRRAFGLTWGEKTVTIAETDEGVVATATAWLMRGKDPVEMFTGKRTMGGFIKNRSDLVKGALENLKSVAVRDLLGLRGRKVDEIRALGVNLGNVAERRVSFEDHGKDESGVPCVSFGKNRGKPLSELDDGSLDWYIKAAKENIADPTKEKWKAKDEARLAGYMTEKARRANLPEKEPGSAG